MDEKNLLAAQFEADRPRLRTVAYRMLGSLSAADDAVQEAWLRLQRADADTVDNLGGWLTTVVARVCLDKLRTRKARREEPLEAARPAERPAPGPDPEQEALLAESIGLAVLVVLQRLEPAERIAFVLHDMFDLPFDQIASIVDRSPTAARQLASRARKRVRGGGAIGADVAGQRRAVEAFLTASRSGDLEGLLAVLAPDVVFRADPVAARLGSKAEIRGAEAVAAAFKGRAQGARPVLVDGAVGVLVAPNGMLLLVLRVAIADGKVAGIEAVADPERLAGFELTALDS